MSSTFHSLYGPLLARAAQQPIGLAVPTNDPDTLKARLYKLQRESNGAFSFSFVVPASGDQLWIISKEFLDAQAQAE